MVLDTLAIAGGLVLLALGGEFLVRGAVGLARSFRVTPAVIGLTVVAAGTSMPELVVSVLAAFQGSPDIAVANVVGSNIFNIGLVLGLTALILPLAVESTTVRIEWPFLLVISVGVYLLALDGLGRLEGLLMIAVLVVFVVFMVRQARVHPEMGEGVPDEPAGHLLRDLVLLAVGIGMLIGGGKLIVTGASDIARALGVSERVIGLTVVAMGTSLPELASSLVAALRGRSDVAVGNIIGSCVFNLLGILGVGSVLVPLSMNPRIASVDLPWMLGFTLLVGPLILFGRRLGRIDGTLLTGLFAVYMVLVFVRI